MSRRPLRHRAVVKKSTRRYKEALCIGSKLKPASDTNSLAPLSEPFSTVIPEEMKVPSHINVT